MRVSAEDITNLMMRRLLDAGINVPRNLVRLVVYTTMDRLTILPMETVLASVGHHRGLTRYTELHPRPLPPKLKMIFAPKVKIKFLSITQRISPQNNNLLNPEEQAVLVRLREAIKPRGKYQKPEAILLCQAIDKALKALVP